MSRVEGTLKESVLRGRRQCGDETVPMRGLLHPSPCTNDITARVIELKSIKYKERIGTLKFTTSQTILNSSISSLENLFSVRSEKALA